MPWCPKCKMEYREGITVCADCGTPLVENFTEEEELVSVLLTEKSELAQKFHDFLEYSDIKGSFLGFVEETGEYSVSVPASKEKEAKRLFKGFYITETEKEAQNAITEALENTEAEEKEAAEEKEPIPTPAQTYVKKEDKYKDYSSTAWTFLVVGIGGLIFLGLSVAGVVNFFNNPVSRAAMGVIFAGCLLVSISSFKTAKKARGEIAEENRITEAVKDWMEQNIKESDMLSVQDDTVSEEVNFLNKINYIRNAVTEQFGALDEAFLDEVTEAFYNSHFDKE